MWLSTKWRKKESSIVSVVKKSQYRDTLSEDTIGNVRDTDYLFFVSRKQQTINIICMQELTTFFLMKSVLFYHERFQRNICDQLTFP